MTQTKNKPTPTTDENRDDRIETIGYAIEILRDVDDSLSCAESCETNADVDANIAAAIEACERMLKTLREAQ